MMRLLVTAISGNVATGVLHSLSEYEYHLFGCDVGKYPAGIDLVEDFFCVPYAQDKGYIPELISACKARQIQAILPTNETELAILDKMYHRLILPKIFQMVLAIISSNRVLVAVPNF